MRHGATWRRSLRWGRGSLRSMLARRNDADVTGQGPRFIGPIPLPGPGRRQRCRTGAWCRYGASRSLSLPPRRGAPGSRAPICRRGPAKPSDHSAWATAVARKSNTALTRALLRISRCTASHPGGSTVMRVLIGARLLTSIATVLARLVRRSQGLIDTRKTADRPRPLEQARRTGRSESFSGRRDHRSPDRRLPR